MTKRIIATIMLLVVWVCIEFALGSFGTVPLGSVARPAQVGTGFG